MTKAFTEVLPALKLPEHLAAVAERIQVTNVTMPRSREFVDIHAYTDQIVSKRDINALEAHVKNQFFAAKDLTVRLYLTFRLSGITAKEAYNAYAESLMEEAKETDHILYNILKKAQVSFPGDGIQVELENDDLNQSYKELVRDVFSRVFVWRFGLDIPIIVKMGEEEIRREVSSVEAVAIELPDPYAEAKKAGGEGKSTTGGRKTGDKKKYRLRTRRISDGYGREFEGEPIPLSAVREEMGETVIRGDIITVEKRALRNGSTLFSFVLTDYTDSIRVKIFAKEDDTEDLEEFVTPGTSVILKGDTIYDSFEKELCISHVYGMKREEKEQNERADRAEVKRVELHCHTKMSDMDAVSEAGDIIKRAAQFGHPAIAITDHGVVQAFPDAMKAAKKNKIKVIYGCEGYLVDDAVTGSDPDSVKAGRRYHIILLAKNDLGRINLYRLVSESHLTYFNRRPRIPRSLLEKHREGLIIGSACEAGEVFRGLVEHESEEEMERRIRFYDYLEIQPVGNNAFMLREENSEYKTVEDLQDLNRKIIELGERYGKKTCATCDVHFLDPEDEVYRRIIMKGQGYEDADEQAPLYFRTTEEMLEEFSYLGPEKAYEVVVTNTNLVADCCETILPVRLDKCPPVIEGSDTELREMCYKKAKELYGDPLPPQVSERLERELKSIIGNGYAVMYIIAQRLVNKSMQDGYLVGSRGSVGSSLAATMAGITEVNPLSPHYRCPKCKYSDFTSEEVKAYAGTAGVDMPDKVCPVCGAKLMKDGFDIPFETFLGFKGDKEPDIDLNFSGEYQARAHAYTEELFGKGYTFKAGTISGLAEKKAFGFVLKYFEEKNEIKRRCEIERLAKGCEGVKNTTGQHPGGIVVMPRGEEINTFTPVQHPANDMKTSIVTTHFDYHSIDQNLLKLDILGHDDPTMIRRLQDLTGIPPQEIPLDDPDVIALFKDTSVLGIRPKDIGGCPLGCLGIPEFGTDFAMQMVLEAKPTGFSDLVRIAGLAHGTDVWLGNAQKLISEGTATLRTAICTRDDIMLYLISMGLDPSMSFKIMEAVRKGKVAKGDCPDWPAWKEAMEEHGVPDWYTWSCEKIAYMFPKAHAAAYVMMAWRVAWCKVHRPLEYYTAYFTVRGDGFRYDRMAMGREELAKSLEYLRKNKDRLSDVEKLILREARIAEEMYARGFEFMPIDLYRAKAAEFQIIDGKIMPSFNKIEALGDKAARMVEEEAKKGKFLSKEDFIQRTHVSSTVADVMEDLGILGGIPKSNQMSLFDIELE